MRTSKKGGRGGSWGVVQPAGQSAAPALAAPVSVYQSGASTSSVGGKILRGVGWLLLVVMVIGAGIAGGAYLYYNESIDAVAGHTAAVVKTKTLLDTLPKVGGPAVALIAGYDHRAGDGASSYAGSNSDTLMLLRADPKTDTLSLLSFPRDLNVPIYCKGDTATTTDRINAAWVDCGADGGPKGALSTIEHLTHVPVNYLITLDFNAFVQVVHRIHGVYLNVDRRYYNPLGTGYSAIDLHPGYQKLSGSDALSYVRFRHLDSDIYRNGRQQLFMGALKQRLQQTLTLSNIGEIPGILRAVKGNMEIENASGTPLTFSEMRSYLGLLLGLPGGHLLRNSIPLSELQYPIIGGASEVTASPAAIDAVVQRFLHPVVPKVQHHDTGKGKGKGTKTPKIPHKNVSVLVLNAGTITGEAANTSYELKQEGFATKKLPKSTPANAPSETHNTIVYYDPSQAKAQKAAQVLAPLFGSNARVEEMTTDIASLAHQAGDPLTVVAIGTAYKGKLKLPHKSGPAPGATKNAQVQDGVGMTLSAVRSKQRSAHFPLFVPHKVASGSSLSTEEGVRLFEPKDGKHEFVLTFYGPGTFDYWQIEESDWTDAPLFANPTNTFTYKGRTYEEFTSGGGKIQTIAVRTKHGVYWVQNTILNSLSNPTMIAIAESLQPHR